MTDTRYDDAPPEDEARVREKAHELWLSEGQPEGRADAHWAMAREVIAVEDSFASTLLPVREPDPDSPDGEPVEPALALENEGELPGLRDEGDESPIVPLRGEPPEPRNG
ncbi:DUF2934 domain-containing protein [Segnochrobactrum spirostomi]|uniref:DUF2934 domain-containing protein n=1 Tax=Segnochrobactrum spirostomi TaxID=2608987 RepID=A0A6A7YAD7_9HYPH|nr:DUF2934 domain-containing protein [Segnochrobactrum spirostomi]MQT14978.1 DUF2934 domain-containing protein [Segnochrobactrum spirostomi]